MFSKKVILATMLWGLMFGLGTNTAVANIRHESPTTQFQKMEAPLVIKAAVTVGGLTLVCLEIWWFLLSKPNAN
jgi:plastocyanin domain-containing protein